MITNLINNEILYVIVLSLGITLLLIEAVVPSFGLIGISGILLIFESVTSSLRFENYYLLMIISLFSGIILAYLIAWNFILSRESKLVLKNNLHKAKGNGYELSNEDLIQKEGIVTKVLRPSGEIEVEGKIYNAISDGNFIEKGKKVVIEKIEGSQLFVKKIN